MRPVLTKRDMYRRLAAGEFGNTIPQFFSLSTWLNSPDYHRYDLWGIRSVASAGDPRCRLNIPREQVPRYTFDGCNISPMIDRHAVLRGEVIETLHSPHPGMLSLFFVPPGSPINPADPWRGSFRNYGRIVYGPAAWLILNSYLWPGDVDDLKEQLTHFPEHTIEFSACDRAVGNVPNRNTVIWECRCY